MEWRVGEVPLRRDMRIAHIIPGLCGAATGGLGEA
jgi:hypothetical protein